MEARADVLTGQPAMMWPGIADPSRLVVSRSRLSKHLVAWPLYLHTDIHPVLLAAGHIESYINIHLGILREDPLTSA